MTDVRDRCSMFVLSSVVDGEFEYCTGLALWSRASCRWLRLRMNLIPVVAMLIEPTQISVFLGLAIAFSLWHVFAVDPLLVLAAHLVLHACVDYCLLRLTQVRCAARSTRVELT